MIKEEAVKAVVYTGYSDGAIIPELFDELKAAGIVIIYRDINPTPANSRAAEHAGADMIVATGFDEGGTLPGTALGRSLLSVDCRCRGKRSGSCRRRYR